MISIGKPRDDRFCIVRVLSACHGGMTAWWTVAVGKIVTYIDYILCIYIYYTHISYIYIIIWNMDTLPLYGQFFPSMTGVQKLTNTVKPSHR